LGNAQTRAARRILVSAASLIAAVGVSASGASASTAFQPFDANFAIDTTYPVSAIAIFESNVDGGSSTNSFYAPAGASVITNPFAESSPILTANLLGVATNLATDNNDGQMHLVMFVNDTFAAEAENVAFGTLFPNTDEDTLINALEIINQTPPGGDTDLAYSELGTFEGGDAVNGPDGPISFTFGGSFTELAFTDGQIIGTGTSYGVDVTPTSPTPEPATWALMLLGAGGVGAMLRRARNLNADPAQAV
jgi:hypothetical protein